ncbi:alpha/beta hydrolase family protein [Actinophytocola gossypii]|uniref:DUF1023 domain-containing protein n=1 Tax=Actinophytocola gossypii TaxID=2812003 RepID=A0ABT2JIL0_9PSEU|nr:alpha/beta hydrolase family protein [Actinophytocola gossypii]MCT2587626.1 hypothetical protein [Actinophytocola gossypii]
MVTFNQLRDLDVGIYARQAEKWTTIARRAGERGDDVQRHLDALADWIGPASDNAKAELGVLRRSLRDMTDELDKIPPVVTTLHDTLSELQGSLRRTIDEATGKGFQFHSVGDDGTVTARAPLPDGSANGAKDLAAQLTTTFQDLLRRANEADATAATELRKLTALAAGFAPSSDYNAAVWGSITVPARGTSPENVLKWWDGLSIQQREALLFNRAEVIGAMDGIPAAVRDRANRSILPGMTEHVREEVAILEARHPISAADQERLAQLRDKLNGLEGMIDRLNLPPDHTHPQAYLLKVETEGLGRTIVAVGNPDTATNVATYVPGTGTRVGSAPSNIDRADNMVLAAADADPRESTAVVTYMDYEAPQNVVTESPFPGYAEDAAGDLREFQHGLRVTHDDAAMGGPSHNTLIGHSYGGEVVGLTAREGAVDADALVFVATPTVGVEHPAGLQLTGVDPEQMDQRVYHTIGDDDPMRVLTDVDRSSPHYSGGAGVEHSDPRLPSPPLEHQAVEPFGGTEFAADPGTAHSDYWDIENDRMNASLEGMGNIIVGMQPAG